MKNPSKLDCVGLYEKSRSVNIPLDGAVLFKQINLTTHTNTQTDRYTDRWTDKTDKLIHTHTHIHTNIYMIYDLFGLCQFFPNSLCCAIMIY